jgi:hypothetical protein
MLELYIAIGGSSLFLGRPGPLHIFSRCRSTPTSGPPHSDPPNPCTTQGPTLKGPKVRMQDVLDEPSSSVEQSAPKTSAGLFVFFHSYRPPIRDAQ